MNVFKVVQLYGCQIEGGGGGSCYCCCCRHHPHPHHDHVIIIIIMFPSTDAGQDLYFIIT